MAMTVKTTALNDGCFRVDTTGLVKSSYDRKLITKYKHVSESTYRLWYTFSIPKNTTPQEVYQNYIGDYTEQRLTPNQNYDVQVILAYATSGNTIATKKATASTKAATGAIDVTATSEQYTLVITGLKPTAYYGRHVRIYEMMDDGSWGEIIAGSKRIFISNTETVGTITVRRNAIPGKEVYLKVELSRGTQSNPITKYKTITTKIRIPFENLSWVKISWVHYEAPNQYMEVGCHYSINQETIETTTFKLMARHDNTVTEVESFTGSFDGRFNATVSPLLRWPGETIQMWVEVSEPNTYGVYKSSEYEMTIDPLFHWDTDKVSGEPFNITADEWNRMVNYVNAAYALYPSYFQSISNGLVDTDDAVTASIANAAHFGPVTWGSMTRYLSSAAAFEDFKNNGLTTVFPSTVLELRGCSMTVTFNTTSGQRSMSSRPRAYVSGMGKIIIPAEEAPILPEDAEVISASIKFDYAACNVASRFSKITANAAEMYEARLQQAMRDAIGL